MAQEPYLVIARKWRPQSFEDVIGQQHITRTLQNAIRSGRIGHAFLFIGTRGVGKTTTARILAKALNCLSTDGPTPEPCGTCNNCVSIASGRNIDVAEIDGASNNGVENIREIRENVRMVPTSSRYKIYIIDEVHQLSAGAFNALLKTLEEPPEHALFVLATTEAHKVPATIVSRCQRYDFRRVGTEQVGDLLRRIIEKENVKCSEEALQAVARAADGSVRDGESILEQLISYCGDTITFADVFNVLGLVDWQVLHELSNAMLEHDVAKLLRIVEEVTVSGKDLSQFVQDILQYYRNLLVCKTADPKGLLALPEEDIAGMQAQAEQYRLSQLIKLVEQFAEVAKEFDSQIAQRIALEALLIRLAKVSVEVSVDDVLDKLAALGAGGIRLDAPPGGPPANPKPAASAPELARAADPEQAPSAPTPAPKRDAAAVPQPGPVPPQERPCEVVAAPASLGEWQRLWPRVVETARDESFNLGILTGQAQPVSFEGGRLLLRFDSGHQRSAESLARPEIRAQFEAVLSGLAGVAVSFEVEVTGPPPETAEVAKQPSQAAGHSVPQDQVDLALQDPGVARVVEVFRGHIVQVKPGHA